jgi:large subunit ribosomal protein L17
MRHHNANRKFGRKANVRLALMRSLARSLVLHESIQTTEAKAKELRPFVEKMVTKGKIGTLHARRMVASKLNSQEGAKKIFDVIAPKYKTRSGGYTRIIKTGIRDNGGVPMAEISFV